MIPFCFWNVVLLTQRCLEKLAIDARNFGEIPACLVCGSVYVTLMDFARWDTAHSSKAHMEQLHVWASLHILCVYLLTLMLWRISYVKSPFHYLMKELSWSTGLLWCGSQVLSENNIQDVLHKRLMWVILKWQLLSWVRESMAYIWLVILFSVVQWKSEVSRITQRWNQHDWEEGAWAHSQLLSLQRSDADLF